MKEGAALKRLSVGLVLASALLSPLGAACGARAPVERPAHPATAVVAKPRPVPESLLYGAEEALRDVLSGDLEYIGTGRWPGVERSRACAFRNQRVVIVNAYCTLNEMPAFRIDVYSPRRGRVRIYAEANGSISVRDRKQYFSFMVETGQPPGADTRVSPLTLNMPYEELQQYEQRRYNAFLPGCVSGEQNDQSVGGCLGALAPHYGQWAQQNRAFLERPNADWYRVVRQMRALAARYGAHPSK
jgi:hypothetical protein